MPKSKHRRKGDKRPVRRSGRNEGKLVNYQTAEVDNPHQPPPPNPDDLRKCAYLDRVATLSNIFTKEQCGDIINNALNNWNQVESMIQRDAGGKIEQNFVEDLDYRNTTLFVPKAPDEWLFTTILDAILNFNMSEGGYQFQIHGLAEPPNVMRYQAPDIDKNNKPGRYDWHMDVGPGAVPSMRKLSYSILLNVGEYEGGELAFHIGRNSDPFPGQTDDSNIGNMLLFPSYCVHRVLPVTKGTRYAIVGWAHGPSFQ